MGSYGKAQKRDNDNNPPSDNLYVMGLPIGVDDDFIKQLFQEYGTVKQCRVLPPRNGQETSCHAMVRFGSEEEATNVKNSVEGGTVDGSSEPLKLNYIAYKPKSGGSWVTPGPWSKGDGGKGDGGKGDGKGDGWGGKGDSWGDGKGDGWGKGDPMMMMMQMMMGKGGKDGGKGAKGKGKNGGSIHTILKAFEEAKCLPGAGMSNDDNALYVAGLPPDTEDVHLFRIFAPFGAITSNGITALRNPDGSARGIGFVNYVDNSAAQAAMGMLNGAEMPDGSKLTVTPKKKQ